MQPHNTTPKSSRKVCSGCGVSKPTSAFRKRWKSSFYRHCGPCSRAYANALYRSHHQPEPLDYTKATWLAVVGYESYYEVSDTGRIRRIKVGQATHVGFEPKQSDNHGYLRVGLSKAEKINGRYRIKMCSVHQIVAEAFIGPCPPGRQVNHRNGSKHDNQPSNLEYMTPDENMKHALRMGLSTPLERDLSTGRFLAKASHL